MTKNYDAKRWQNAAKDPLTAHTPLLTLPDIAHKLRLQPLSAKLSAYIQGPFAGRNVFIPWTQIQDGAVKLAERCPDQPPAVAILLQSAAVWSRAAIKEAGPGAVWSF